MFEAPRSPTRVAHEDRPLVEKNNPLVQQLNKKKEEGQIINKRAALVCPPLAATTFSLSTAYPPTVLPPSLPPSNSCTPLVSPRDARNSSGLFGFQFPTLVARSRRETNDSTTSESSCSPPISPTIMHSHKNSPFQSGLTHRVHRRGTTDVLSHVCTSVDHPPSPFHLDEHSKPPSPRSQLLLSQPVSPSSNSPSFSSVSTLSTSAAASPALSSFNSSANSPSSSPVTCSSPCQHERMHHFITPYYQLNDGRVVDLSNYLERSSFVSPDLKCVDRDDWSHDFHECDPRESHPPTPIFMR